jgi:hypothetical protein
MHDDVIVNALATIDAEIKRLQAARDALRALINGAPTTRTTGELFPPQVSTNSHGERKTNIELAADAIRDAGRDLHISEILAYMKRHGRPVKRRTLSSSIHLHQRNKGKVRIKKTGQAIYGLAKD